MKSTRMGLLRSALANPGVGLLKEAHSSGVWLALLARPRGQKVDV